MKYIQNKNAQKRLNTSSAQQTGRKFLRKTHSTHLKRKNSDPIPKLAFSYKTAAHRDCM